LAGGSCGIGSPLPTCDRTCVICDPTCDATSVATCVATCDPTGMAGMHDPRAAPAPTRAPIDVPGTDNPGPATVRAGPGTAKPWRPHAGLHCSDACDNERDHRGGTPSGTRPCAAPPARGSQVAFERRRRRRAAQHRDVNGPGHRPRPGCLARRSCPRHAAQGVATAGPCDPLRRGCNRRTQELALARPPFGRSHRTGHPTRSFRLDYRDTPSARTDSVLGSCEGFSQARGPGCLVRGLGRLGRAGSCGTRQHYHSRRSPRRTRPGRPFGRRAGNPRALGDAALRSADGVKQ